jgi:voltage-gated potassium channel
MPFLSVVPRQILVAIVLLLAVITVGTVGYMGIEGWAPFDSLYMTITTITTVGGGEATPLSPAGRAWTLIVIVLGVGAATYTFLALGEYVLEGQLGSDVGKRRMQARVRALSDHFVLCGYGRVGREIAREFTAEKVRFVVIDLQPDSLAAAERGGHLTVAGNAADIDVLREAGIERARGLITATDVDADNVYVTLSARVLRPDIFIVARGNQEGSHAKLRLAGANRIISPYSIGGKRMASLAMRPTAVDFIDTILEAGNTDLLLEDLTIPHDSQWAGRTLAALIGPANEAMVLALKRDNIMTFRPPGETALKIGDEIVAAGPRASIRALEERL